MVVTAQVPDVMAERIAAVAQARGLTRSAFVREAISKHLDEAAPIAGTTVRVRSRKPASDGA